MNERVSQRACTQKANQPGQELAATATCELQALWMRLGSAGGVVVDAVVVVVVVVREIGSTYLKSDRRAEEQWVAWEPQARASWFRRGHTAGGMRGEQIGSIGPAAWNAREWGVTHGGGREAAGVAEGLDLVSDETREAYLAHVEEAKISPQAASIYSCGTRLKQERGVAPWSFPSFPLHDSARPYPTTTSDTPSGGSSAASQTARSRTYSASAPCPSASSPSTRGPAGPSACVCLVSSMLLRLE